MKASSIYGSFLSAEDIHEPTSAVIAGVAENTFEGKRKLVIDFEDLPGRLSLNSTNAKGLIEKFGDDTEGWIGRTIVLYVDENVFYLGKKTAGLRITFPDVKK